MRAPTTGRDSPSCIDAQRLRASELLGAFGERQRRAIGIGRARFGRLPSASTGDLEQIAIVVDRRAARRRGAGGGGAKIGFGGGALSVGCSRAASTTMSS